MIVKFYTDSTCSPASIIGVQSFLRPEDVCTPKACSPITYPGSGDHIFGYEAQTCDTTVTSSPPVASASFSAGSSYVGIVYYTDNTCAKEYQSSYLKADGQCYYTGTPSTATISMAAGGTRSNWKELSFNCSGPADFTESFPISGDCVNSKRYINILNGTDLSTASTNKATVSPTSTAGGRTSSAKRQLPAIAATLATAALGLIAVLAGQ